MGHWTELSTRLWERVITQILLVLPQPHLGIRPLLSSVGLYVSVSPCIAVDYAEDYIENAFRGSGVQEHGEVDNQAPRSASATFSREQLK